MIILVKCRINQKMYIEVCRKYIFSKNLICLNTFMISAKYTYAFANCPVASSYVSTFVENFSTVIVIIGFHYSAKFRMFRVSHIIYS